MPLGEYEEFDVVGKWWVPGRPQPEHPGSIVIAKDERPYLKLFDNLGFFTKPENGTYTDRSFSEFFPIVCGRTQNGPATLINFQHNYADFMIFNALFESEDEARFKRIRLQFQHFPEWIRQPIIDQSMTFWKDEKGKNIGNELRYKYRSLPEETFLSNGLEFKILFGINTHGSTLTSVTLTPMAYLDIVSTTPKSVLEWWGEIVRPIRDLFSFALDKPIDVTRFNVFDERDTLKPNECRVYFKGRRTNKIDKEIIKEDTLFSRSDLGTISLETLIGNWFRIINDIPMVCNLYSSVTSIREQYLEEEFLSLAQAAELYHRSRYTNSVMPHDEWKDKTKHIIDSVPENYRKWLREKLMWSNSPTLQNRLEELLKALEPITSLLVADKVGFATIVKHTRNYFTHWDEKQQKKAASHSDLYFVSRTLMYLIAACIMIELGFASDKVADLFKRNHRIHNFRFNTDNPISTKMANRGESTFFSIHTTTESDKEG